MKKVTHIEQKRKYTLEKMKTQTCLKQVNSSRCILAIVAIGGATCTLTSRELQWQSCNEKDHEDHGIL